MFTSILLALLGVYALNTVLRWQAKASWHRGVDKQRTDWEDAFGSVHGKEPAEWDREEHRSYEERRRATYDDIGLDPTLRHRIPSLEIP